jgi:CRP/FNR family transcriptional regulator, cyclic AMP receptor protein
VPIAASRSADIDLPVRAADVSSRDWLLPMSDQGKPDFEIFNRSDLAGTSCAAGDRIIAVGEPATKMYVVRKGRVSIEVDNRVIEEIGPGGIFGEMALIAGSVRSTEAVAMEDCEVVPISERLFLVLAQETPSFALDVMRVLSRRLRDMNQYV